MHCRNCDSLAVVAVAHSDLHLAGCHLASIGRVDDYFLWFLALVCYNHPPKIIVFVSRPYPGDLRQGSSDNSVTNFVLGFPYIFQREIQHYFEDLLSVVLVTRDEDT